jgi:hypothetical protein
MTIRLSNAQRRIEQLQDQLGLAQKRIQELEEGEASRPKAQFHDVEEYYPESEPELDEEPDKPLNRRKKKVD